MEETVRGWLLLQRVKGITNNILYILFAVHPNYQTTKAAVWPANTFHGNVYLLSALFLSVILFATFSLHSYNYKALERFSRFTGDKGHITSSCSK